MCSISEKLIAILEKERQDDNFMMKVFCNAKSKAQISTVTLPRVQSRSNPQMYSSRRCFYKEGTFVPYYQWLIDNLSSRFSIPNEKVFSCQNLTPSQGAKMNLDKLINVMEPMKSLLPFGSD